MCQNLTGSLKYNRYFFLNKQINLFFWGVGIKSLQIKNYGWDGFEPRHLL